MIYLYIIIIIIIIIIISTIILISVNYNTCPCGFINNNNLCKADIGTKCNNNNDCTTGLYCNPENICAKLLTVDQDKDITKPPITKPPITHPKEIRKTQEIKPAQIRKPQEIRKSYIINNKSNNIINNQLNNKVEDDKLRDDKVEDDKLRDDKVENIDKRLPSKMIIINNKYRNEMSSSDDEINSNCDRLDMPFDVRSQNSDNDNNDNNNNNINNTNENDTNVSIPYNEKNGIYYCRNNKIDIISNTESSKVIDICTYSTNTVFLLENTDITIENSNNDKRENDKGSEKNVIKRYKKKNNVKLCKITTFYGYLYGLGENGYLYILQNISFESTDWLWQKIEWSVNNIIHISATYNGEYLWTQTDDNIGYLYDKPNNVMEKLENVYDKRVYGRDEKNYVEINEIKHTAIIRPGNYKIDNIYDAALSYYNELVTINIDEKEKYKKVVIINWKLYYLCI